MLSLRKFSPLLVVPALLSGSLLMAQASNIAPRISTEVNESRLTQLKGSVPANVYGRSDQGEAAPATQMTHVRILLSRSAEQELAINKYMAELVDKSSPNYHKWLTPDQYGKLYGPADSDIAAVEAWLESHGLKVEQVSSGRTNIAFSGTVSQIEEALHTQIHVFQAEGQQFYSNITEPSIPSALAPVVLGVARLNTFKPVSHRILRKFGKYDPTTGRMRTIPDTGSSNIDPDLTYNDSGTQLLVAVPADVATIYNTPNSTLNANYHSGTSYTGKGVTIGLGGNSAIVTTDVVGYRSLFLGNSIAPTITNTDGVGVNGDAGEAYLDVEVSGGMAPDATIHLYVSSDLFSAIEQAIADNTVDIFSLSFGSCELDNSTADNQYFSGLWQQMEVQGIAVTVSTGDDGSAACDDPDTLTVASQGLGVSGLASTPYNIAVGGSDYYGLLSSFSTYVTEATASGTTAGAKSTFYRTAKSYIPESSWNESTASNNKISANVPAVGSGGDTSIFGGSGGASSCSTNTTVDNFNGTITAGVCTSGYAKPSWQKGTGVPKDGVRDVPDVSLLASSGVDGALWLTCGPYTSKGVTTEECVAASDGSFSFGGAGGTSASSPAFAGILALVQQKVGSRIGLDAQSELYGLYNGSHSSAIFHDITVGNNSVYCSVGSPDCAKNAAGNYFESGYDTTTGYDLATGLGSVDASALVTYWGTAVTTVAPTVGVTPSVASITTAQSLDVAVSVTGTAGTATGTVTLSSGSYTSSVETLNGSGAFTFTVPAGSLSVGTDTLTVSYSGDSNYSAATATGSVTVTAAPAPVVTLTPTSLPFGSIAVGVIDINTLSVTVKNTGNAGLNISGISITGTNKDSFTDGSSCPAAAPVAAGSSCTITVTFAPTAAGSLTATLNVTDDASGSPQKVTLTGTGFVPAPIVSLSPTSLTFASTAKGSSTAAQSITLSNTGTAPLSLTGISIAGTNPTSYSETDNCGAPVSLAISGSCKINVTFTPAALGTLTATVSVADSNAAGSPQTVTLTGSGTESGSYSLAATTPAAVAPGSSATSTITATGTGGYAGPTTITLSSCALATSPSGATDTPTCTITGATITFASGASTGSGGSVSIGTTAATSNAKAAHLDRPNNFGRLAGAGGIAIAGLLLFGIPARRFKWKGLLGVILFAAAVATLSGCGGGGGGGGGGGNPGTTAGTYTFTVTGKDAAAVQQTATVTLTVN